MERKAPDATSKERAVQEGGIFTIARRLSMSTTGAPTARVPQAPGNLSRLVLERCHFPGSLG
eukprot:283978-Alexandrium_andersonii.AAC.1